MAAKDKSQHFSTRVDALTYAQLDLMKDLKGLASISDLTREYIMQGLKLDSVDIEQKVEERLASERKRLQALAGRMSDPDLAATSDDDDDEGPDMFTEEDESALVMNGQAKVPAPATHDDLVPD